MNETNQDPADIGVIGLAVMGQNLILNMNDHGYKVVAYNRTTSKVDEFLNGLAANTSILPAHTVEELISKLKVPRRVMLMVKAGDPVDQTIEALLPHLEQGDIIIDGGNSLYTDTERRVKYLEPKGLLYIGTGISGGEEGARHGPSIMPGGSEAAWPHVKEIFQSIAAKLDDGTPCCEWIGPGGSGHYVKMVHNGIEYGDEQLICEAYFLLKRLLEKSNPEMAQIFSDWNNGELNSYLIEITAQILGYKDEDGSELVDKILDVAGQKGTGKWTVISSAELGQPLTLISEALFSRFLSSLKDERVKAASVLTGPQGSPQFDRDEFVHSIRQALYSAKIISYTQGYMLLRAAASENNWQLNYGGVALMWRGGCIIRSKFLGDINNAYRANPELDNLLIDPFFANALSENQNGLRNVVATAATYGIPVPAMSSALAFYDGYRSSTLPANLLQAQRDYFGAHTYERLDKNRGEFFHTNWTGSGGDTSSTSYNA